MDSKSFTLKVLGLEALLIAALGTFGFFYARPAQVAQTPDPVPAPKKSAPPPLKEFAEEYGKESKTIKELAGAMPLRADVDLILFVIDTSASMSDDRDELKNSIKAISEQYKGRAFEVINFSDTAQIAGEPTRRQAELQRQIDSGTDLGGIENSYQALVVAANKAREKVKHPAIVLMTDAAPNDGQAGSISRTTINQAADALNAANAELHVWAAFDFTEYQTNGSAATTPLYKDLVSRTKAGGNVYLVKRGGIDPNWLLQN
jgi:von Willebrand factor type A domain